MQLPGLTEMLEAIRITTLSLGAAVALALGLLPRLACRRYAQAIASGRDRSAARWARAAGLSGRR